MKRIIQIMIMLVLLTGLAMPSLASQDDEQAAAYLTSMQKQAEADPPQNTDHTMAVLLVAGLAGFWYVANKKN